MSSFFVYILYSKSTDTFYKGQTQDLQDRLGRHNAQQEKATASGAPWILIWFTSKPTRAEAMALETKLKNLNRQRLLQFILKYQQGVVGFDELLLVQQLSECRP